jgi:hypothetical protein
MKAPITFPEGLLFFGLFAGCHADAAIVDPAVSQHPLGASVASSRFSDWSAPVNLGPPINTPFVDAGPAISKDGLSLYLMSNRPGGSGFDLWVSERERHDAPWAQPVNLGPLINSPAFEDAPALSRDGHWLFFVSDRLGSLGGRDVWASWRRHIHDNFGWQTPINLGPGVNSPFDDVGPAYFEDDETRTPKLYFASDRPGGVGTSDIYVSELGADGTFGPAVLVPELSSLDREGRPAIRFDGLEMMLHSGPLGSEDLLVSARRRVFDGWGPPTNLGAVVNSAARDIQPYFSADRKSLFFASTRAGGQGLGDIYVTTRSK